MPYISKQQNKVNLKWMKKFVDKEITIIFLHVPDQTLKSNWTTYCWSYKQKNSIYLSVMFLGTYVSTSAKKKKCFIFHCNYVSIIYFDMLQGHSKLKNMLCMHIVLLSFLNHVFSGRQQAILKWWISKQNVSKAVAIKVAESLREKPICLYSHS